MRKRQQLSLFDQPTLNIDRDLHEHLNLSAKKCGLSRDQIVDDMNRLADKYGIRLVKGNGNGLSKETLEKWLNPNDTTHPMPIRALPVFCAVVGGHEPLDVMARPLGYQVIGEEEQKLLKWARAYQQKRHALREMRQIENELEV